MCKCLNALFLYLIPTIVVIDSLFSYQSQMLATIICVFGRDLETFLLKDDLKYDSYLIHYGYLLQTWSKLYIRVELLKHLSPTYRESGWEDISINRIYPPIQVCPTPAAPETHYEEFQGNQDIYLNGGNNFRCSICNNTKKEVLILLISSMDEPLNLATKFSILLSMLSCILTNVSSLSFLFSFMNFIILESIWVMVSGEGVTTSVEEKSLSMVDMVVQRKTNG